MASSLDKVLENAMNLNTLLIESLEGDGETGAEEAWLTEVERRMEEIDSGAVQTLAWSAVKARLFNDLNVSEKR